MPHDVFIAWDHTVPTLRDVISGAVELATKAGVPAHALGLDPKADGIVPTLVQAGVRDAAKGVLVLLDTANVNVAYELGLALGHHKAVALGCSRRERPTWLLDQPPLHASLIEPGLNDEDKLLAKILRLAGRTDAPLASYAAPTRAPSSGTATLVLAPQEGSGKTYGRKALEALPGARTVPKTGWSLDELPHQLDGVGRVVLLLPQPGLDLERDVEGAARLAIVAGYAHARGRDLKVVVQSGDRAYADLILQTHKVASADEAAAYLRDLEPLLDTGEANDPIAAWRRWVRRHHADLIPFSEVAEVIAQRVELSLAATVELEMCGWREQLGRGGTLHQVLTATSVPDEHGRHGRWLIAAEPGAGKTTSLRQVAQALAHAPAGPTPLLLSLADLFEEPGTPDLFAFAERLATLPGLAQALRDRRDQGTLWLMLDGLDEVSPRRIADACAWLRDLAEDERWQHTVIVATTRTVVLERHAVRGHYQHATLSALRPNQQLALLQSLAPEVADPLWQAIERDAPLADLVRNPLMLTLFALTGREVVEGEVEEPLAVDRVGLYRRAVRMLLTRGRGKEHRGVPSPREATLVLAELSYRLQSLGGEAWRRDTLSEVLMEAWREQPDAPFAFALKHVFGDHNSFLDLVMERSALLGPRDGPGSRWRYLHRSLREYLAAVALHGRGEAAVEAWVGRWQAELGKRWDGEDEEQRPDPARYGEVFALLCGLEADPAPRLERLREVSPDLFMRALTSVDGLRAEQVVAWCWGMEVRYFGGGSWDGDDLEVALLRCRGRKEDLAKALWQRVNPNTSTELLGIVYVALERLVGAVDRRRFFAACGRALPAVGDGWVRIEAGRFRMGSPEGVGDDAEHPQHEVLLTQPFLLGRTTVTNAEYARFDPEHPCTGGAKRPVTMLNWYMARLYAVWLGEGGRLPTEAEWEYACRAGTNTQWWCGDDEQQLAQVAWFGANLKRKVQPVARLAANPWGLHDMHGHVLEWCQDGIRIYDVPGEVDPEGPTRGERVVRGGHFEGFAESAGSAARYTGMPLSRDCRIGFRVRLPAPARDP